MTIQRFTVVGIMSWRQPQDLVFGWGGPDSSIARRGFVGRVKTDVTKQPGTTSLHDATPMPNPDDVEQLMRNAVLRDALEPYLDESVALVNVNRMPTSKENEFLESMLAWERAPILPVGQWFSPELVLPSPDSLDDASLHVRLWETINRLYDHRVVIDFTDHLSDRELYCVIFRDILPSPEKKIELPRNFLHWHCLDEEDDMDVWLRYYASDANRLAWSKDNCCSPPPKQVPPYPRQMPRRP